MRPGLALTLVAVVQILAACASQEPNRLAADAPAPGMHSVFVLAHGYHTGLAVRSRDVPEAAWPARRDFPDAEFLVLGWGEREYYPHDDPGVSLALRAILTPSSSTLHVLPITGSLPRVFHDSEIIELRLTEAGFRRLVDFVRDTYELDASGQGVVIPSGTRQQGRFYASPRTFHAFENCNTWVARALQHGGLAIDPDNTFTAGALLRQVRPLSAGLPAVSNDKRRAEGFDAEPLQARLMSAVLDRYTSVRTEEASP